MTSFSCHQLTGTVADRGGFVVNSQSWQELDPVIIYLTEQYRQDEGDDLAEILTAMRAGDLRRHHAEKPLERADAEVPYGELITELIL